MNKKIIALAVVAGLAAPMTANAATTVYGKINTGIVSYDNDAPATATENDGLGIFDESSRLGVKGSEDIGGGLKAYFKMEGTVDIDGGGSFDFNRDTYVGIQGGFGKVQVGRYNTAYKNATGKMDLFADRWGDITGGELAEWDQREENMIGWSSKVGMVDLALDLALSERKDDSTTNNEDESEMGVYASVGFKPVSGLHVTLAYGAAGGASASGSVDEGDDAMKLGVQYKTGPHTVNFIYEAQSYDEAEADDDNMTLQYGMKMGKNTFAVSYTSIESDQTGGQFDASQISLGVMHKLSKSTEAYVVYSTIDNDADATHVGRFGAVGGTAFSTDLTGASGHDPSGLAVGIQHNF